MTDAYINKITTAVPPYDVHERFAGFALSCLKDNRYKTIFERLVEKAQIEHRYSFFGGAGNSALDETDFYRVDQFPDTDARMRFYKSHALDFAKMALDQLDLTQNRPLITHVIITSCTGFYAPALDLQIVEHYGFGPQTERTIVGFMGCSAAFNALSLARHIVRSTPRAQVLIVNLELCTAHLQATDNIEKLLSFLIFADGCAASVISAEPYGIRMDKFMSSVIPDTHSLIMWDIGMSGFDMVLSGKVPLIIGGTLNTLNTEMGASDSATDYWAIHPGGRTVLDAVQKSLGLSDDAMRYSRGVLRDYGNMSSATVMFVLKSILEQKSSGGGRAIAFGPGVTVEQLSFYKTAR